MAVFRVLLMVVYLENDVLSEKSGLAHRFSEGIDVRLLMGNLRTEDTTGDLCDFRKTIMPPEFH
jgi:hypothetical protein